MHASIEDAVRVAARYPALDALDEFRQAIAPSGKRSRCPNDGPIATTDAIERNFSTRCDEVLERRSVESDQNAARSKGFEPTMLEATSEQV